MTERGALTIMTAAIMSLLLALGMALVDVTKLLAVRAGVEAAADAAALAAAPLTFVPGSSPAGEAASFATANGARLIDCRCRVDRSWRVRTVEVMVEAEARLMILGRHTVRVASRAEFDPLAALVTR